MTTRREAWGSTIVTYLPATSSDTQAAEDAQMACRALLSTKQAEDHTCDWTKLAFWGFLLYSLQLLKYQKAQKKDKKRDLLFGSRPKNSESSECSDCGLMVKEMVVFILFDFLVGSSIVDGGKHY